MMWLQNNVYLFRIEIIIIINNTDRRIIIYVDYNNILKQLGTYFKIFYSWSPKRSHKGY